MTDWSVSQRGKRTLYSALVYNAKEQRVGSLAVATTGDHEKAEELMRASEYHEDGHTYKVEALGDTSIDEGGLLWTPARIHFS
jgi:hypothetical protein